MRSFGNESRIREQGESRMTDNRSSIWNNKLTGRPKIDGMLEISQSSNRIFIGGDPAALRSLARLLTWLADIDQNALRTQPDGERCHVHLHANDAEGFNSLTPFSMETEVCRLDAKGTGEFPEKYYRLNSGPGRTATGLGNAANSNKATRSARKKAGGRGIKRKDE
jgi:hypothetical protein